MDYEKKYKELVGKIEKAYLFAQTDSTKAVLEEIRSELKESEDERIRKELIQLIGCMHDADPRKKVWMTWLEKRKVLTTEEDLQGKEDVLWCIKQAKKHAKDENEMGTCWFAEKWLEKQGCITKLSEEEQNRFAKGVLTSCALSFINYLDAHKYEDKMCVSNGECEDIDNAFHNSMWDRLHRYYCKYIEKQDEQPQGKTALEAAKEEKVDNQNCVKSSDNIEPKFHVGDWIISNDKKSIYQVIEVKRGIYVIRDNADNHEYHIGIEECEKNGRIWTIHYAKNGDVLASGQDIFIFKEIRGAWIYCYCLGDNDGSFMANSYDLMRYNYYDVIHPATKEQRDILYKAMVDAGYSFDFEKKELKKIKQKPAWSEEDKNEDLVKHMEGGEE